MSKLLELPKHKRPREKIMERGVQSLSEIELLMVLIGSGTRKFPVQRIARSLQSELMKQKGAPDFERISRVPGLGIAKAAGVLAAFELARRKWSPDQVLVRKPEDVLPLVHEFRLRAQEHFLLITLNGNHAVINTHTVTIGLANFCQVHPREVFIRAITDHAAAVVFAHNHPSQNLDPSPEDLSVTERLCRVAQLLGIRVLDHVIFSRNGYRSLRSSHAGSFAGL